MSDYTPRNWNLVKVPFDLDLSKHTTISPLNEHSCGMDSGMDKRLRPEVERFYYDYEQLSAGLDKVYGASDLRVTTSEFTFEDGTIAREGALILITYDMDMEAKTFTAMVEVI